MVIDDETNTELHSLTLWTRLVAYFAQMVNLTVVWATFLRTRLIAQGKGMENGKGM